MRLSEWLSQQGMKRIDFAERIGASPSYVSGICAGAIWPSKAMAAKIAEVTSGAVQPNDFMSAPDDSDALPTRPPAGEAA